MNVTIVPSESLLPKARQIAHHIAALPDRTASIRSPEEYRAAEHTLTGKEPTIFLGDHAVSRSFAAFLPEQFRGWGGRCMAEGGKVVLIAETPAEVSSNDLRDLQRAVETESNEMKAAQDALKTRGPLDPAIGVVAGGAGLVALPLALLFPFGTVFLLGKWLWDMIVNEDRRTQYAVLQYEYLLVRYLREELERMLRGLPG